MDIKEKLKSVLSPSRIYLLKGVAQFGLALFGFAYDAARFLRWSSVTGAPRHEGQLAAAIIMDAHRIEKGLVLPHPRPGFGRDIIKKLLFNAQRYAAMKPHDTLPLAMTCSALKAWTQYAADNTIPCDDIKAALATLENGLAGHQACGGTAPITKDDILDAVAFDFSRFFTARHSIRHFLPTPVSEDALRRAIETALKTPSVCNRQSWRVHAFLDPALRAKALSFQNGNRGFGHEATAVLLITTDLQAFLSAGERYQGWIDGGMFAMSLILALHAQGLGTCPLNWSVPAHKDWQMRKALNIPANELTITMVAVGHLPDALQVAASPRKTIADILTVHRA